MDDGRAEVQGCLDELRGSLADTRPFVDRGALRRILRRHGLGRFPDGFMVAGPAGRGVIATLLRRARRGQEHPLFSSAFYRAAYPDVATSAVDPWSHYQLLGRNEGRRPHPFIDPEHLARQMPGVRSADALDRYLVDASFWDADPSPYIDAARFRDEGPWDGRTPPLLQVLRDYPVDPWVRSRLGLIDLADARDPVALAIGVLGVRRPALARMTGVSAWRRNGSTGRGPGAYRVIPGYFIADAAGEIASVGRMVESPDGTALRSPGHIVALDVREVRECRTLAFCAVELGPDGLAGLASELGAGDLAAPVSREQEEILRVAGIETLPHGRQATVRAQSLRLVGGAG